MRVSRLIGKEAVLLLHAANARFPATSLVLPATGKSFLVLFFKKELLLS
jgi:hypothetical protein